MTTLTADSPVTLMQGDCLALLPTLPADSIDAVVADPPAGIGFMGAEWDDFRRARNPADAGRDNVFGRTSARGPEYGRRGRDNFIAWLSAVMVECYRVAKPGARCLIWAIPRTSHWTGTAIENAGWVIEDRIAHVQAQGFPKHRSKLKPAVEDWWMAWKPAAGAVPLNIDQCRVECPSPRMAYREPGGEAKACYGSGLNGGKANGETNLGRWPAHLILDPEAAAALDEQSGTLKSGMMKPGQRRKATLGGGGYMGDMPDEATATGTYGDSGGASRYFHVFEADPFVYCPKATKPDRGNSNRHPTVKPQKLMRHLCRLITPKGGTVLDWCMGSGSTGKAAAAEGFRFVGIERDPGYFATAERRINEAVPEQMPLFGAAV